MPEELIGDTAGVGHHPPCLVLEEKWGWGLWKPGEASLAAVRASPWHPGGKSPWFSRPVVRGRLPKGKTLEVGSAHVHKGIKTFYLNVS